MGPKRKHLHSDCFSADVLSYRKKNFEMIKNKKKIIFMHINDIRRVLNGRADILKIRIMLQFFFHDLFFLIHTQSFKSIDSNECVDLCLFFGFFFLTYTIRFHIILQVVLI